MRARRLAPPQAILAALLVAALALVAIELGKGAAVEPGPKLADPCRPREAHVSGPTREELVLSLGGADGRPRRWSDHTIEVALRAGLLRAVDEAVRRGDLPGFAVPFLRRLIETAPLDRLVKGGITLSDLLR